MRYRIDFDRLVNRLSTHYLSGRRLVLYLQALMKPLQTLNDGFSEWAKETKIEVCMTSQVFKLEWYLNRKFGKYFLDAGGRISIGGGREPGTPIYMEDSGTEASNNLLVKHESEGRTDSVTLYYIDELSSDYRQSFTVYSPAINTELVTEAEYLSMLSYYIDKYKISGKTYQIKFNS
jgi:hypothetical protein